MFPKNPPCLSAACPCLLAFFFLLWTCIPSCVNMWVHTVSHQARLHIASVVSSCDNCCNQAAFSRTCSRQEVHNCSAHLCSVTCEPPGFSSVCSLPLAPSTCVLVRWVRRLLWDLLLCSVRCLQRMAFALEPVEHGISAMVSTNQPCHMAIL